MLNAEVLTFQKFALHEPLPLSRIHEAVFEFLKGRDDSVLLLRFPELKVLVGDVRRILAAKHANKDTFEFWRDIVGQGLKVEDDDADLSY